MISFSLLGSGSGGNALLVLSGTSKILIDNGLSYLQLCRRTEALGQSLADIQAVFVTHEHRDHVLGLRTFCRKHNVPVYMTEATRDALPCGIGPLPNVVVTEAGDRVEVAGLTVTSFSVAHDAADPVSYVVECDGCKLGIAGDLGQPSTLVHNRLAGSHALVLESNYCPRMMQTSKYPASVLQRIRSTHGHLSNQDMSSLLDKLKHDALETVVLVHISKENNTPELARSMAARVLAGHSATLHVASQNEATPLFQIQRAWRATDTALDLRAQSVG